MVRTDNANDVGLKCRAKHELCHLFMPEGPDDYGYAQNDHKVMDLGADEVETQCLPLNDWSVKFIEDAYDYGWVDPSAPDSVYDCQP